MTRGSLFQWIFGGIAAVFMPKSEKKESKASKVTNNEPLNKWQQLSLQVECECNNSATCYWPTIKVIGIPDDENKLTYSIWENGNRVYAKTII